ncbi:MAG: TIM barrel protein [Phycisphaerales bacterium]|nr:TIM barrel protein [Phycisphaerales bacterium]
MTSQPVDRRFVLKTTAALGAAALGGGTLRVAAQATSGAPAGESLKGRLKQSVCRWCYGKMSVDDLCKNAAAMGLKSVELLGESEWSIPEKYGLTCAVANGPTSIARGWNRAAHHDEFVKESERLLPLIKQAGLANMIVFSGNREGLDDREGIKNCVAGLKRIAPLAEQLGVTVVMELLNSKVDHKDYQCDHTAWGVEVVQGVSSPRFKLLYDIYHMQIMEGDVIRTVLDHLPHIAHFHTGGVPGRNEIDETQELQYPAICRAIVEAGFTGYLAQEFIPRRDPMTSLRQATGLCDV